MTSNLFFGIDGESHQACEIGERRSSVLEERDFEAVVELLYFITLLERVYFTFLKPGLRLWLSLVKKGNVPIW
jgi:hypothetical protein